MLVETFEVQEATECSQEGIETIQKFVEEMGLEGQEKYFRKDTDPCPYRKITAQEKIVYQTLCGKETTIQKYADGPIPLRVLQVGSHAVGLIESCELVVWHPENGDFKDPILLGKVTTGSWSWEYYLLARWGEVLEEFAVLQQHAKKIITAKLKAELTKVKMELETAFASVETVAEASVLTGVAKSASFYFH